MEHILWTQGNKRTLHIKYFQTKLPSLIDSEVWSFRLYFHSSILWISAFKPFWSCTFLSYVAHKSKRSLDFFFKNGILMMWNTFFGPRATNVPYTSNLTIKERRDFLSSVHSQRWWIHNIWYSRITSQSVCFQISFDHYLHQPSHFEQNQHMTIFA